MQFLATPLATFLLVIIGGLVCSKLGYFLINKIVRKITQKTKTTLDDEILDALAAPVQLGIAVIGVFIALKITENFQKISGAVDKGGYVALIFFATWILSRLVGAFLKWYGTKMEKDATQGFLSKQILPFSGRIISILIFLAGITMILAYLGVEIAPLIGSLGIVGLAVALAAQDTLSNFFAGLYFLFEKPLKVGDFLTIEGGLEGFVEEIGWRNTKLSMLNKGVVVIPNTKLAQSTFTNRNLKEEEFSNFIRMPVAYDADLEKTEKIIYEAAEKVLKSHPDAVNSAPVNVMLSEFEELSILYKVFYVAKSYTRRGPVENALRHEILKALRENGIAMPLPTRVMITKK
jgi:small-conductance mechanosensitive channel